MQLDTFDFSARGWSRVVVFTIAGTLVCIAAAFFVDSYRFDRGTWEWGTDPINNVIVPLLVAPPFFFYLLTKLRQLAIAHHELKSVASTDALTSCLNRRAFTAVVDGYLERMSSQKTPVEGALLVIDVDHFKWVNDRFGHLQGDDALRLIARAIRDSVRDGDPVGRIGGEEFGVFLVGVNSAGSGIMAERIRAAISETAFAPSGERYGLSASVGGVTFDRGSSYQDLFQYADQRLYVAKRSGRNRVDMVPFGNSSYTPVPQLH